ncbi:Os05g0419701 [Oryza sativa Japonica Group]|uniref:Uncharacterized protein n=2 Tax=Oryza sativa subsp. japonica TaxID=39947 RepID=A0A8J8YA54_ORYSJ|nr:hypothetical protein OsJ_18580 [Oryza sativa Japonica Group]BAS94067.1 Os05g0419701 [Oryza sativa Japonica Group]
MGATGFIGCHMGYCLAPPWTMMTMGPPANSVTGSRSTGFDYRCTSFPVASGSSSSRQRLTGMDIGGDKAVGFSGCRSVEVEGDEAAHAITFHRRWPFHKLSLLAATELRVLVAVTGPSCTVGQ